MDDQQEQLRGAFTESYRAQDLTRALETGEALVQLERSDPLDQRALLLDTHNLAYVYELCGQHERAVTLYTECLQLLHQFQGGATFGRAQAINDLAVAHCRKGDYQVALALLAEAMEIVKAKAQLEPELHRILLYNIANAQAAQGETAAALQAHIEALSLYKAKDLHYADIIASISYLYEQQQNWERAVEYGEKAVELVKRLQLQGDRTYGRLLYHLAELYIQQVDFGKAARLYMQVIRWIKAQWGNRNSSYVMALTRLSFVYANMDGMAGKARECQARALEVMRDTVGENHVYYANSLKNYASLSKLLGEYGPAAEAMEQALAIKKRLLGEDSQDYVNDLIYLVGIYVAWRRWDEALRVLMDATGHMDRSNSGYQKLLEEMAKLNTSMEQLRQEQP